MTDEERQRKMDFIIEQQAQFAVDIQVLREGLQDLRAAQARTDEKLAAYAETQSEFIEIITRSIQALVDAQLRTDAQMKQTDEQTKRTDERLSRTDERLNALIDIVERHISEGHQHGS
jgi:uncharacterized FlaG/YvyC family protein